MVYNSKHLCTYQYYDSKFKDFIPKKFIVMEDVDDCEESADLIYKSDILQVFNLTEYDDAKVEQEMMILFEILKNNEKMVESMTKLAHRFITEEIQLGMVLLFSYDTFYIMHLCICDIIEKGEIEEDNLNILNQLIN
jgi:hypothetical protein